MLVLCTYVVATLPPAPGQTDSILARLVSVAIFDQKKPFPDRCAALYCFESALHRNEEMQLKIVGTFFPSEGDAPPSSLASTGPELCKGLLMGNAMQTWFAASWHLPPLPLPLSPFYCSSTASQRPAARAGELR